MSQSWDIPYFLEISLHLKIPLPSKCHRIFQPIHPNKCDPQNLTHALYMCTCIQIGSLLKLCTHVRVDLCRHCPRNLAALKLSPSLSHTHTQSKYHNPRAHVPSVDEALYSKRFGMLHNRLPISTLELATRWYTACSHDPQALHRFSACNIEKLGRAWGWGYMKVKSELE